MKPAVQIVAHRGASAIAPENTVLALHRAWECGVPWCEVDVQRSSDGVPLLVHDDTWLRTAGVDQPVRTTPWSTVQTFDVGAWHPGATTPERVPRLEDALLWTDRLQLNLEIKSPQNDADLAEVVARAVLDAGATDRTLLTCFDAAVIETLARRHPQLRTGYLGHHPHGSPAPGVSWQILEAAALLSHPEWLQADGPLATWSVWAWTVDSPDEARRLVELGVQGLITNDPAGLRAVFP